MAKDKIIAMLPARMGSTRLAMKNLALLCGKPLIYYAIKAAKESGAFDKIIINSEHQIFAEIAKRYGVSFYRRPEELGSSTTKSDHVVYDFINKNKCDIVAWVNTTSPLQSGNEIKGAVEYFLSEGLDALVTVKNEQVHCVYKNKPVNFEPEEVFAQTQDLTPVQPFVYSVMMWRAATFKKAFESRGYAFFCGKTGFYPVSKETSVIIKREEDLILAERILRSAASGKKSRVKYDRVIKKWEGRKK